MHRQENIYNLIPRIIPEPEKIKRYTSKHNPLVKPTGSTFLIKGSTKLDGSNLGVAKIIEDKKESKSFGKIVEKPNPHEFTKKGSRTNTNILTKSAHKFSYNDEKRKPAVVKKDDKPLLGLISSKDFITTNAVDAILSIPGNRARIKEEPAQYLKKMDYGKVPSYLNEVKNEVARENDMIEEFVKRNQQIQQDDEEKAEPMDENEKKNLIQSLKAKWDHTNKQYQKMCHNIVFDTHGKIRRKETLEKELTELEKDIDTLQKGNILISKER